MQKRKDWLRQTPGKVNAEDVEKLGRLRVTEAEAAAFFDVRHHVFTAALADPKIRSAWDRGRSMALVSLRRDQMRLARTNPSMAIFLGKNLLGQRDVSVIETDESNKAFDASKLTQTQRDNLRTILAAGAGKRPD